MFAEIKILTRRFRRPVGNIDICWMCIDLCNSYS